MNVNKCLIAGRLVRDPELRYLPSQTAVCSFSICVNRTWKDKDGEKQEEATFLDVESFAKTAEVIAQYFKKGSPIWVDGRLRQDSWEDKEGNKRSKVLVVCENFQFVESRRDADDQGDAPQQPTRSQTGVSNQRQPEPQRRTPNVGPQQKPRMQLPPKQGNHQPVDDSEVPF